MQSSNRPREQRRCWDEIYVDERLLTLAKSSDEDEFFPVYNPARKFSHTELIFRSLISDICRRRVLCIGGGVDKVAVYLAGHDNDVVSQDVSPEAGERTRELAKARHVESRLETLARDWEQAPCDGPFEVVITHDSLHHMDVRKAVENIHRALAAEGTYIGMEPICLMRVVQALHRWFPFHPYTPTDMEADLSRRDLEFVAQTFGRTEWRFLDLFTRESIAYWLHRIGLRESVRLLGRADAELIRLLPSLRPLSSYVLFRASKEASPEETAASSRMSKLRHQPGSAPA